MRALRLSRTGSLDELVLADVPIPEPKPGEVLVKIARAAFNRRDVFIAQGLYPGISLPCTLGSDGAGTVAALGSGVAGIALGASVVIDPELGWDEAPEVRVRHGELLGMPRDGTFAEYVAVPQTAIHPVPVGLSLDEAAAFPLAGSTAYRAVFTRGRIAKDDLVLIPGVGSGVQTFVLLYAVWAGARTIVTSGSDEKLARAKALGAEIAINYRTSPAWHKEALRLAGAAPSLVIDGTGGETLARSLDIARTGARVVVYGATSGDATVRPFSIFWKHLDILGTSAASPADFAAMLPLFASGVRPALDHVYPVAAFADAARRVLAGDQFGKVLLSFD